MKTLLISFLALLGCLTGVAQTSYQQIKISDEIKLIKLSDRAYIHVSVFDMQTFGKVSSNGLIIIDKGEALLFDTPVSNEQTSTLVTFLSDSLHTKVIGFIPNHFHGDCMGGLEYLHKQNVQSYANQRTIEQAKKHNLPLPQQSFKDSLSLKLHDIEVDCYYLGGGHATDNIVVWIPSEKILFPGCMVKDMSSSGLGNLSDADVNAWPHTIAKVIAKFPSAKTVIPGHGKSGGVELLKHTRELLSKNK